MKDLFELLNNNCRYVVLRNWDDIFNENIYGSGHEDIDILCDNQDSFIEATGAYRVHKNKYRDNFIVPCGELKIRFDVRWVGDGYYPTSWEKAILERRRKNSLGIFVPSEVDYFYSLAYHALIQKKILSTEYLQKLQEEYKIIFPNQPEIDECSILEMLGDFLKNEGLQVSIPLDPAVNLNWYNIKSLGFQRDWLRMLNRKKYYLLKRIHSVIKR